MVKTPTKRSYFNIDKYDLCVGIKGYFIDITQHKALYMNG